MADVDRGNCPSCNRPRAGSLESVGNSEFCWKTDVYCTQYERDTKPFRDRIRALESELASARTAIADLSYQLGKAQGEAEGHRLVRVGLEAELADVRTLDDFNPNWHMAFAPDGGHYCLPRGDALAFGGTTPDEARAKAAAWAREQTKGAKKSGATTVMFDGSEVKGAPRCTCSQDNHPMWAGCQLHDFGAP